MWSQKSHEPGRRRWRRPYRAAVATLCAAVLLTASACSSDSSSSDDGSLLYWSMWTEEEPDAIALQKQIDAFEKESGIKVEVQWLGRDVMTKVLTALRTNDVPDVVNQSTSKVAAVLGPDQFLDLTDFYNNTKVYGEDKTFSEVISPDYSSAITIDDKVFQIPHFPSVYALWYDGRRFPDLEAAPPKTWEEFTALFAESRSADRAPLALDADITSYAAYWLGLALTRSLGPDGLKSLVENKDGDGWDSDAAREALDAVAKLVDDGAFITSYDSSKWPAIERKWFDGKADFLLMGSWVPLEGTSKEWAPEGFEMKTFSFPGLGGSTDLSLPFESYGFSIPKKAKNASAAKKFIAFMLSKDALGQWSSAVPNLPSRQDLKVTAPGLKETYALINQVGLSPFLGNVKQVYPDYYANVFEPLAHSLIVGKVSADEFSAKISDLQKTYWKQRA